MWGWNFHKQPHDIYNEKLIEANKIHKWDIEEEDGFVTMSNGFKVYDIGSETNKKKAADLLYYMDLYIKLIQSSLKNKPAWTLEESILANTPMKVQETPYDSLGKKYHGICKPKGITTFAFNYYPKGTKPNSVRNHECYCKYRLVMMQLRTSGGKGKLRSWKDIKDTLLHELAHAMRNHLQYFEKENHEKDFHHAEKVLIDLSEHSECLKEIDSYIMKLY